LYRIKKSIALKLLILILTILILKGNSGHFNVANFTIAHKVLLVCTKENIEGPVIVILSDPPSLY